MSWATEAFASTGAKLPVLPSVPITASNIAGWSVEVDGRVSAEINGARAFVMDAAGVWIKRGFGVASGIGAMISLPGLNNVAGFLSAAGPAGAAATAVVKLISSLFGSRPPEPPPTVDGIDEGRWSVDPLANDRWAVIAGKLVGGVKVDARNKASKFGVDSATLAIRNGLIHVASLPGWSRGTKLPGSNGTARQLALALSYVKSSQIEAILTGTLRRRLDAAVKLSAWGAPRVLLLDALGIYGLLINAEATESRDRRLPGGTLDVTWPISQSKCWAPGYATGHQWLVKGRYSRATHRAGYTDGSWEKDLCDAGVVNYRNALVSRLFPAVTPSVSATTGRWEAVYPIPADVVEDEIQHYERSGPAEVYLSDTGHTWTFKFNGIDTRYYARLHETPRAIREMFLAAASDAQSLAAAKILLSSADEANKQLAKLSAPAARKMIVDDAGKALAASVQAAARRGEVSASAAQFIAPSWDASDTLTALVLLAAAGLGSAALSRHLGKRQ